MSSLHYTKQPEQIAAKRYLTSQRIHNLGSDYAAWSHIIGAHLPLASHWQIDIFQLIPQLPVVEKMESYFGWDSDLRWPLLMLLLQGSLRLLFLLLLSHSRGLCRWWGVVNTSVHMSFQHTASFESPIADGAGSNIC